MNRLTTLINKIGRFCKFYQTINLIYQRKNQEAQGASRGMRAYVGVE